MAHGNTCGKRRDRIVKSLWIFSAASAGAVKSETCVDAAWVCSGRDTEMSSCIFSGSNVGGDGLSPGTLGKPCYRAMRCREAMGAQDCLKRCHLRVLQWE
jgi:hypothetical protein